MENRDPTLKEKIVEYYEKRGLVWPDCNEAFTFVIEEMGELARSINNKKDWVRNNERPEDDPVVELGDMLMMVIVSMIQCEGKSEILLKHPFMMLMRGLVTGNAIFALHEFAIRQNLTGFIDALLDKMERKLNEKK